MKPSILITHTLILISYCVSAQNNGLVSPIGDYQKIPLEKDKIVLKVLQTQATRISENNPNALEENLKHMLKMGNKACLEETKPDILLYHEFPLTGWFSGKRQEKLNNSIQIPGKETKLLGELAKSCDAYLIFGAYVKDQEWPGHILSINTVIDRKGEVVKKFWKSRNIKRFFVGFEINTTTVEGVRDRYRAKYGIEEEFPILKTEFGNLAVSTVQFDPFVFAAFAMRGAEIMLRTATLFSKHDVIATAVTNNFYTAMANIPYNSPQGGKSLIVAPNGKILAEHPENSGEGIVTAILDIKGLRKGRRIPQYSLEITKPVFNEYTQEIPLNHLDLPPKELPEDGVSMKKLLDKISRWIGISS